MKAILTKDVKFKKVIGFDVRNSRVEVEERIFEAGTEVEVKKSYEEESFEVSTSNGFGIVLNSECIKIM